MGLYRRKDSSVYWMSFTVDGRYKQVSTGTSNKALAERIYHLIKLKVAEGKWFEVDEARTRTFDELVEKFMKEHAPLRAEKTQKSYKTSKNNLRKYFTGMTLAEITADRISDYMQKRKEQGVTVATINREFAMLSKAFNLARKRWKWCKDNPCGDIEKEAENNQIERYLLPEEEERLLKASECYQELPDIIRIALNTGMRQGEIINLKWNNIDLFKKTITVLKTKNKQVKTIPMNDTVFNILLERSKVRSMSGYIFVGTGGERMSQNAIAHYFDHTRRKAGMQDFRFHDLRHTAASRMVQNKIDIYIVSKILGHKDIRTTMRYAHHNPDSLRAGVKILDKFNSEVRENPPESEAVSG